MTKCDENVKVFFKIFSPLYICKTTMQKDVEDAICFFEHNEIVNKIIIKNEHDTI